MKFSRWLNSLSGLDQITILLFLLISIPLTNYTLTLVKSWYEKQQMDNPYAQRFRVTPFAFAAVLIPYFLLLYWTAGSFVSSWLSQLF